MIHLMRYNFINSLFSIIKISANVMLCCGHLLGWDDYSVSLITSFDLIKMCLMNVRCSCWNMGLEYVRSEFRVIRMSGAAWAFHYVRLAFLIPVCISTCSEKPVELWLNKNIASFSYFFFSLIFSLKWPFFCIKF